MLRTQDLHLDLPSGLINEIKNGKCVVNACFLQGKRLKSENSVKIMTIQEKQAIKSIISDKTIVNDAKLRKILEFTEGAVENDERELQKVDSGGRNESD